MNGFFLFKKNIRKKQNTLLHQKRFLEKSDRLESQVLPKKHRTQKAFQADCFWGSSLKGLLNLKFASRIQPLALWGISGKTQIPKFFAAVFGCYMFKPGTYPVKNKFFWWLESSIGRWFQVFACFFFSLTKHRFKDGCLGYQESICFNFTELRSFRMWPTDFFLTKF